jgi:hypothetical protein
VLIAISDARRLFDRFGLDALDDPVFEGDSGLVEHLAHEVGHALSLGLTPSRGIDKAIALTLNDLPRYDQILEEALVLAAEAVALPRLGVHFAELGVRVLRYMGRRAGAGRRS